MKNMKKLFCLVLTLCWGFAYSSAYAAEPIEGKIIEEVIIEGIRLLQPSCDMLPDGTFILTGSDRSQEGIQPAMAVSVSPFGEINWKLTDQHQGEHYDSFINAVAFDDGSVYATHMATEDDISTMLLNRIENGMITTRTDMEATFGGYAYPAGDSVIVTIPRLHSSNDQGSIYHHTVTSYDSNLNVNWTQEFDFPLNMRKAISSVDGHYLLGFSTIVGEQNQYAMRGLVMKVNMQGNILWQKMILGEYADLKDGVLLEDGSIVVAGGGHMGDDMCAIIAKISNDGELLWQKNHLIGKSMFSSVIAVEQGFLAASLSHVNDTTRSITLSLMDSEGEIIKQWTVGEDGILHDTANLFVSPYGAYLVTSFRQTRPADQTGAKDKVVDKVLIQKIDVE